MVIMHPTNSRTSATMLIAIGMRFWRSGDREFEYPAKQAKIIHFEIDPAEVNKNVKVDLAVLGDKESLPSCFHCWKEQDHASWFKKFGLVSSGIRTNHPKRSHPTKEGLTIGERSWKKSIYKPGAGCIVSDVGQHQMIACRYAEFNQTKSKHHFRRLGTMGFALPAAIGAKMAVPEREVVAIIGDGGIKWPFRNWAPFFKLGFP